MEKITKREYSDAIFYLRERQDVAHRVFMLKDTDCVVSECGNYYYICDSSGGQKKYFREHAATLLSIYSALSSLYLKDVIMHINNAVNLAGFDDCSYFYGPLVFNLKVIREMVQTMQKIKAKNKK